MLGHILISALIVIVFIAAVVLVLKLISRRGNEDTRQTASIKLQAHLKSGAISRHPSSLGK